MNNYKQKIGFSYFVSPGKFIRKQLRDWMESIQKSGASMVTFRANFNNAIPEDAFIIAQEFGLEPVVHFSSELPLARKFNDIAILLDVYIKWGVEHIIFGDKPNTRQAWPLAGWHYENLVDHFIDRFIPLANFTVQKGAHPVFAPLHPGGDYWDTAFLELALTGLRQRRLDDILDSLVLACYGYTFNKPLTWGSGGPQRWPLSKPYQTPEGQEDQLGFMNFGWAQAQSERATGVKKPVLLLNSGYPGTIFSQPDGEVTLKAIRDIACACREDGAVAQSQDLINFDKSVLNIGFSLETIEQSIKGELSPKLFDEFWQSDKQDGDQKAGGEDTQKIIPHYLLLPSYASGVSDVVLNKVRPIIKKYHPTVGFSITEASHAKKVSIFPDPLLFSQEQINELRASGCVVEELPESGIDIAMSIK
jgi:hypothetical protein